MAKRRNTLRTRRTSTFTKAKVKRYVKKVGPSVITGLAGVAVGVYGTKYLEKLKG